MNRSPTYSCDPSLARSFKRERVKRAQRWKYPTTASAQVLVYELWKWSGSPTSEANDANVQHFRFDECEEERARNFLNRAGGNESCIYNFQTSLSLGVNRTVAPALMMGVRPLADRVGDSSHDLLLAALVSSCATTALPPHTP